MKIYLVQHRACLERTITPEQSLIEKHRKNMDHIPQSPCKFLEILTWK